MVINFGVYIHISVAICDVLAGVVLPFVEVHLLNVYKCEVFRHHSYFSDIAEGVIVGLGPLGYRLAIEYALERPAR